jgi:hypothetical protein
LLGPFQDLFDLEAGNLLSYITTVIETTFRTEIDDLIAMLLEIIFTKGKTMLNTAATQDLIVTAVDLVVDTWVTRSKTQGHAMIDSIITSILDYALENLAKGVMVDI